jgi:hypothetical protein
MVKKPAVADVEVVKNKTVVKKEQVKLGEVDAPPHVANIGFSAAFTKNLGNFESLKVTVSLHMPVTLPTSEPCDAVLDSTFNYVQGWVDAKVTSVLEELEEQENSDG